MYPAIRRVRCAQLGAFRAGHSLVQGNGSVRMHASQGMAAWREGEPLDGLPEVERQRPAEIAPGHLPQTQLSRRPPGQKTSVRGENEVRSHYACCLRHKVVADFRTVINRPQGVLPL